MTSVDEKTKRHLYLVNIVTIFTAVACYWIVSIGLVFVNKYLLSSPDLKLNAPFFITWFQCIVTVGLCYFFSALGECFPSVIKFPKLRFNMRKTIKVLPLSIVFVAMITLNNLCLQYVGVSFYYVGRSLTTVFNVICTWIILSEKTSFAAIFCCGIIISGFLLGVDQEKASGSLSVFGVICGVLASLFVALYAIYVKKKLPVVDQSIWDLTLLNNINASILFVPLFLLSNEPESIANFAYLDSPNFWTFMFVSGFLGFIMGYVTGWQIQATSPLTHNISGTAKAAAQTVLGVVYFMESKTLLWWLSNGVVLVGSGLYTKEMKNKHNEEKAKSSETSSINSRTTSTTVL